MSERSSAKYGAAHSALLSEFPVKVIVPEKHAAKEEADRIRSGALLKQLMQHAPDIKRLPE